MGWKVAIAGAGSLLGNELLRTLEAENAPVEDLRPLADVAELEAEPESEGASARTVTWREDDVDVRVASPEAFEGCDVAFLAGTTEQAGRLAKLSFPRCRLTIDLSGRFADSDDVPLVLAETGLPALPKEHAFVAVPDAATAMVALALAPLHKKAKIKTAIVSTYEAASGLGRPGMDELGRQIRELFNYRPVESTVFPKALAFNCLPQIDAFEGNGYTRAELSMARGVARILGGGVNVLSTRVWVPVFSGHSASVVIETETPLDAKAARAALDEAEGVKVVDDPVEGEYPVNGDAVGGDTVDVGRIRADGTRLSLWIAADNLRRGGALTAARIAQTVLAS